MYEDLPDYIKDAVRTLANANLRSGQPMQQALENACEEILQLYPEWVTGRLQHECNVNPENVERAIRQIDEEDRQNGRETPRSQLPATCRVLRNGAVILQSNSPEEVDAILQIGDVVRHPSGQGIQILQRLDGATIIAEGQQETQSTPEPFAGTPRTSDSTREPFTGTPHRLDNFDLQEMD